MPYAYDTSSNKPVRKKQTIYPGASNSDILVDTTVIVSSIHVYICIYIYIQ